MRSTAPTDHLAARMSRPGVTSVLRSMLPTGVFLAFDASLGLAAGMIAASITSAAILVLQRKRGAGIGVLLPISLAFVVVKAVAGVLTDSAVVSFGSGVVLSAFVAIGIGATAFTARPAASYALPPVTPYRHLTLDHPVYRRVAAQVTAVVALAELTITTWEGWHLTVSTASEFVVARTLTAWPGMGVVIFFVIFYVRFRLDRHEHSLRSRELERTAAPTIHRSVDVDAHPVANDVQVHTAKGTLS